MVLGDAIVQLAAHRLLHWDNPIDMGLDTPRVVFCARPEWGVDNAMDWLHRYLSEHQPPSTMVFCLGGEDIVRREKTSLSNSVRGVLKQFKQTCPDMKIIWSDILPRRTSYRIVNTTRKYVNKKAAGWCDSALQHPKLILNSDLWDDDVHPNEAGLDIFLSSLKCVLLNV